MATRRQERLHGVALHDPNCTGRCKDRVCVLDVEAFVVRCINQSGIPFTNDEWEDLIAEGIAILYHLHARYRPEPSNGHTEPGRFAGYAAAYLPKRLSKAWHRSQPNHILTTNDQGKATWVIHPRAASLNELMEAPADDAPLSDEQESAARALVSSDTLDPLLELHGGPVTATYGAPPSSFVCNMNGALRGQLAMEHRMTVNVAWLRGMDMQRAQIASTLGVSEVEVRMAIERIKRIGKELAA